MYCLLALLPLLAAPQPLTFADLARIERRGAEGQADARVLVDLTPLLASEDWQLRGMAALAISRHAGAARESVDPAVVAGLLRRLDDPTPHIAPLCRRSLGILGSLARPEITTWLGKEGQKSRTPRERRLALEACRLFLREHPGLPDYEAIVWDALLDPDPGVADFARVTWHGWVSAKRALAFRDVDRILAACHSPNPATRELALNQLVQSRIEVYPVLLPLLESRSAHLREETLTVVVDLIRKGLLPGDAEARLLLVSLELDASPAREDVRRRLRQRLGLAENPAAALEQFVDQHLKHWGLVADDRPRSLRSLQEAGLPALRVLESRTLSREKPIRLAALDALAALAELHDRWDPPAVFVDLLAHATTDPDDEIALASLRTFRTIARPDLKATARVVESFTHCLHRPNPRFQVLAVETLARFGSQAGPVFAQLIQDPESQVQRLALLGVRHLLEQPRIEATALQALQNPLQRLSQHTDATLAGPTAALLLAVSGLLDLDGRDTDQRRRGLRTLERLGADGQGHAACLPLLARLLAEPDLPTRGLTALAIARHIGTVKDSVEPTVVAALLEHAGDENEHVAAYCRRSLLALGPLALPEIRLWLHSGEGTRFSALDRLLALEACTILAPVETCRLPIQKILWKTLLDRNAAVAERARLDLIRLRRDFVLPAQGESGALVAALNSPNRRIRALAREHLLALEERALPELIATLRFRPPTAREEAAGLVLELLRAGVTPTAADVRILVLTLAGPTAGPWPELRAAVERLAKAHKLGSALTLQVEALLREAQGPRQDWEAVTARLQDLGEPGLLELELLLFAEPRMRRTAMEALLHLRTPWKPSPEALEALAVELYSPDEDLAHSAAILLRYRMTPLVRAPRILLDALVQGLADDNRTIREYCTQALAASGPQAEQVLLAQLDDRDPDRQHRALYVVLYTLRFHRFIVPPRLAPRVSELTRSPSAEVARLARHVLGLLKEVPRP